MAVLAVALLAPAAQAREPAPGYSQFAGCPSPEEKSGLALCLFSNITGGHLQMGTKDVPIENPLTLSGGADENFEGFSYNSKGGLSKTKQKVPGGVIGLTGLTWLLEFFGSDALTLYAETELAGTPTNFTINSVTIPIKVHLTTPSGVLGSTCYIGSNASPITLKLITGTTSPPPPNKPITGKEPTFSIDGKSIIHLNNGTYVDNSFSVPGASGCVLKLFGFIPISLNSFVNSQGGLPSPAGKNEAVQNFNLEFVERGLVYP
ncbi:MAG TPA: hypothetical protein VK471_02365 [Solirubrobacterales bacterium]|nr:hypothetical protein [Solirubrobacterales bacterium]